MPNDDTSSSDNTCSNVTSIFKNKAPQSAQSTMSNDLQEMLASLRSLRGDNDTWLKQERAIGLFMADSLNKPLRIWAVGEWRSPKKHLPAVLVFHNDTFTISVWAPLHSPDELVQVEIEYFHCRIPHAGIAQEVYGDHGEDGSSTI